MQVVMSIDVKPYKVQTSDSTPLKKSIGKPYHTHEDFS